MMRWALDPEPEAKIAILFNACFNLFIPPKIIKNSIYADAVCFNSA
jgi:hypothetical protein